MRDQLDRWLTRNGLPDSSATRDERREFVRSMPAEVKRAWDIRKSTLECESDPEYNRAIAERATKRMARVDAMPRELREVVYEYSLELVQEFLNCGVKKPQHIAHLIDTVRHTDMPNGQKRFKINKGPNTKRNPAEFEHEDEEYFVVKKRA